MQLSVDQKIEKAIQPLLERISALEAENEKFKQELATIHASHQPKPIHKPGVKPVTEPIERPQTVKGGRKKSVQQHATNVDNKTDKKPLVKKQDGKGQGQELKHGGSKTGINSQKGIVSPNINKDHIPSNPAKDIKTKPITTTGGRTSGPQLTNKGAVGDKKNTTKPESAEHEKKEGEDNQEEKKQHKSQDKVDHKQPGTHGPKTPVINKGKTTEKPDIKKPVVTKPVIDKKPPTKPSTTAKKPEQKKQAPAEVAPSPKQQTSPEPKQQSPQVVQQEVKQESTEPKSEQKVEQTQQQPAEEALLTEDLVPATEQQPIVEHKEQAVAPAEEEETL